MEAIKLNADEFGMMVSSVEQCFQLACTDTLFPEKSLHVARVEVLLAKLYGFVMANVDAICESPTDNELIEIQTYTIKIYEQAG